MRYKFSQKWTNKAREIALTLEFNHIILPRLSCIKSSGTKTRRTIARIHSLSKSLQIGMHLTPCYVIELISEKFDKLSEEDKIKVIIHELMHIPHSFSGGFRHHKPFVTQDKVEQVYMDYLNKKENQSKTISK